MASSSPLLALQAAVSACVAALLLVIWAATGADDFWPLWVWHELAVALALHWALRRPGGVYRVHVGLTAVAAGTVLSVWLLFAGGAWIVWPLLGLALGLAAHDPIRRLLRRGTLTLHAVAGLALAVTAGAWLSSGAEGDWILWPVLGIGGAVAAHAVCREHVTR